MDAHLPSEEEYLNGRMHDGSRPPLFSQKLYRGQWSPGGDPLEDQYMAGIPGRKKDELVFDAERLKVMVIQQTLDDLDISAAVNRVICTTFLERAEEDPGTRTSRPPEPEQPSSPEETPDCSRAVTEAPRAEGTPGTASDGLSFGSLRMPGIRVPKAPAQKHEPAPDDPVVIPDPPFNPDPQDVERTAQVEAEKLSVTKQVLRGPRRRTPCTMSLRDLPIEKLAVAAQRASMNLADLAMKRRIIAELLIDATNKEDVRTAFIRDRAHAVVEGTLLYLDKHFVDAGFGAWMPFRFPDQWLMFCGVMRRILAANGLLHSQHAEIYRQLMDHTPAVDYDGTIDERIQRIVPRNWGKCWRNRGANDMCHLKLRLFFELPDTS